MLKAIGNAILGHRMPPPAGLASDAVPPGVTLRSGRLVPWLGGRFSRMAGPAAAVTLGRTIIVRPGVRLSPSLLAHELAHVRQWESDPLFPFRYSLATFRHGYRNNPYEVEARQAEASAAPNPVGKEEIEWKDPS
jgi:Domain of unknown function (DUF4157)